MRDQVRQAPLVQRVGQRDPQARGVEGLGQKICRPVLHGFHRRINGAVGGDNDYSATQDVVMNVAQHFHAGHVGQAQIQ